jgi:hypothetical protein
MNEKLRAQRMMKKILKENKLKEIAHSTENAMLQGFLTAALFTGTDDEDNPLDDNYLVRDFTRESVNKAQKIIIFFLSVLPIDADEIILELDKKDDEMGIALWMTMTGQGVGFWDGDWSEYEDILMEACNQTKKKFYIGTCMEVGNGDVEIV